MQSRLRGCKLHERAGVLLLTTIDDPGTVPWHSGAEAKITLFRYFKKKEDDHPDPKGSLSNTVPSTEKLMIFNVLTWKTPQSIFFC